MIFLAYIELLLFAICAFTVFYLLVYAIAATGNRTDKYSESRVKHRFAILIPAYQDDDYIPYTVKSFLQQEYPIDCYDIIVISDHLKPETNRQLAQYPITLLQARFKKSSKMKSVKAAMSQLQEGQYDIVLIMNADNVVDTNFLEVVNNTYASGSNAIQTHRIYQERPSNVSILNAITDEINNSILRAGHVNLGLSASLNGSGTAIDFTWFKENIRHLKDDDDEKVIESLLLRERIYVEYLNNTHVYALKNSGKKKFYTQHSTWIKTQYYSLFTNIGNLPGAILSGKFDYADRILQWFIFPRTILLGILLRILPLERLPKMVGIITHFLIDYGNSHSKLLGGQQIQQSHESYPLSGGRHDIQYAFKKEKIKAPCYRKLYISWNIRYISTFPSVWGI